jgi:hypothetical protein
MMRAQTIRLLAPSVLAALIGACGGSGTGDTAKSAAESRPAALAKPQPGPPQSAALPADGGDVGKAYKDLIAAYQAVDSARATRLIYQYNPKDPTVPDKSSIDSILPDMLKVHPAGGVWQADRATLFLDGSLHGYVGASLSETGWVLDDAAPRTADDGFLSGYKCATSKWFPCAAATFPDAKVSGRIKPYPASAAAPMSPQSGIVLDGFGVRMLDAKTHALAYTEVVLSGTAFEPHFLAGTDLIDYENSSYPYFRLRIAPDGKSAKVAYVARTPELDAGPGLNIDTATPNRIRGHLTLDAKDVAQFDVVFDVGTLSECLIGDNRCGNQH